MLLPATEDYTEKKYLFSVDDYYVTASAYDQTWPTKIPRYWHKHTPFDNTQESDSTRVRHNQECTLMLMAIKMSALLSAPHPDQDHNSFLSESDHTPLHRAALRGDSDHVHLCIKHGALIDAPTPTGTTPLAYAALFDHEEVVHLLLEYGASSNAVDEHNQSVLLYATYDNNIACMYQLLTAGAMVSTASD
jgi:ankyrin repeat protein